MKAVKELVEIKLSDVLNERLSGKNLSQIARELGISKSLLADWVSSRRLPSLKNIGAVYKLAKYLGLSLEQLLLGIGHDEKKIISALIFEDEHRKYRVHIERLK